MPVVIDLFNTVFIYPFGVARHQTPKLPVSLRVITSPGTIVLLDPPQSSEEIEMTRLERS